MDLTILYRGPLSSCNYGCDYCPFAKHFETDAELAADKAGLLRFCEWAEARPDIHLSVFFTPWGEALVRTWYQQAIAFLTRLPNVEKVAAQTNLSCRLDWVERCDKTKLGIWATYHPTEVTREKFIARCLDLDARGVRLSAGVVGLKERAAEVEALRSALPDHIYVWVNAYKRDPAYYDDALLSRLTAVDPLFPLNTRNHPSLGEACRAGHTVISLDGDGTMRRCHFIKAPLGNLYEDGFEQLLRPTPCTNATCGCHIGYVHMNRLGLYETFGDGVLERIPRNTPVNIRRA